MKKSFFFNRTYIMMFILFFTLPIVFLFFMYEPMTLSNLDGMDLLILLPIFILIALVGVILYLVKLHIDMLLHKEAVISIEEKGVRLSYFYNVLLPWEDLESCKSISIGKHSFQHIVFVMKNPKQYFGQNISGKYAKSMYKYMQQYLSPFFMPAHQLNVSAGMIENLINRRIKAVESESAKNKIV